VQQAKRMTDIRVPALGESVTEATVSRWLKNEGDQVAADEPLCELETDKVSVEVPAPAAGVLSEIRVKAGETVNVGAVLGVVTPGAAGAKGKPAPAAPAPGAQSKQTPPPPPPPKPEPAPAQAAPQAQQRPQPTERPAPSPSEHGPALMPSAGRIAAESGLDADSIEGTGKNGRVTKGDALAALEARGRSLEAPGRAQVPAGPRARADREERVPMTRLRQTIAARLKAAQATAAMLTTFNEVDMGSIMDMRNEYKDAFEKKYGVKLGFMGFFVKACIQALKEVPAVNAEIEGHDLIYKNYYDIGVAVGTERGLVVPVLRDADRLDLMGIEKAIGDFGHRARDNKLKLEELQGGTFTISNGGVYGSLLSTPILNAPQSGILGMHKIEQRPVVVGGKIDIRPMMYLALSYDHRIVDGREAVTFLVRVKESLEGPQRLLLGL
jgi:2-oxoglutarate dehydrogenase E2 component (dihydrolipoamide succinyltransferase)